MNLLYAPEARKLIKQLVPWIDGKEFNRGTFDKCVKEGLIPTAKMARNKTTLFVEEAVRDFAKLFPKERPPDKLGVVNILKERLEKKKAAKK